MRDVQESRVDFLGKADEIAVAIEKVLKDETLRQRLARSAAKRANFFSLETHVAAMTRLFAKNVKIKSK